MKENESMSEKRKDIISGQTASKRQPGLWDKSAEDVAAVYTVDELAVAGWKQFGCSCEMVRAAFMHEGKDKATLAEARLLVDGFRKREVK
nr:MAG TPA: hypothetical protein [Caudoviricetes sp.]